MSHTNVADFEFGFDDSPDTASDEIVPETWNTQSSRQLEVAQRKAHSPATQPQGYQLIAPPWLPSTDGTSGQPPFRPASPQSWLAPVPPLPPNLPAGRLLSELAVVYMPVIAAYSTRPVAHEALVRSAAAPQSDGRAIIDAVATGGMLPQLGAAVRCAVAANLALTRDASLVFVNVEEADLDDGSLGSPNDPLTAYASRVVFDLSLARFDRPIPDHCQRIDWLRRRGFRFALDDFGASAVGYSELSALNPEFVKVGASLTDHLCDTPGVPGLLATIARVCASRNMVLVAKAIGRRSDYHAAAAAGVPWLSGWHVGHPVASLGDIGNALNRRA